MEAVFHRFTIEMTLEQALSASHQGECIQDVQDLVDESSISAQLDAIDPADIAAELKGYGAWDDDELTDVGENKERLIWIAACGIREENEYEVYEQQEFIIED